MEPAHAEIGTEAVSPPPGPKPAPPPPRRLGRTLLALTCWAYLAAVVALWVLVCFWADVWWPATLVIYAPRWVWALPLLALLPAALFFRRRSLAPLLVAAVVLVFPFMGFEVPWRTALGGGDTGFRVRVLSFNLDGGQSIDRAAFHRLIAETEADVVACQEWPGDEAPDLKVKGEGWHVLDRRGLFLASRFPIGRIQEIKSAPGWRDMLRSYELQTSQGTLHFFNVHLETPRWGLQAVLRGKWQGIGALEENTDHQRQESEIASRRVGQTEGMVLVAGDFNLPPDSQIFRRSWGDRTDAFSAAGFGFGHTKFTRWHGARIDHQLGGPGWRCVACRVGPDLGSSHCPLIAEWIWEGAIEGK